MHEDFTLPSTQSLRASAATGIALITLLIGAPFAILDVLQGQLLVGLSGLSMCALLCLHAAALKRQHPIVPITTTTIVVGAASLLAIIIYFRGTSGLFWAYPIVLGFYCMLPQRTAWISNVLLVSVVVASAYTVIDTVIVARLAATLVAVSAIAAVLLNVIYEHHRLLVARVETDPLTGVLNRQSLRRVLEHAQLKAQTSQLNMTLLALDIDNFKQINDTGGHAAGDCALQQIGSLLRGWVRAEDAVFRTGGDEFLVLMHDVSAQDAENHVNDLRGRLEADVLLACGTAVSMSGGLATLQAGQNIGEWLSTADSALYRAKAAGRNRIVVGTSDQREHSHTLNTGPGSVSGAITA